MDSHFALFSDLIRRQYRAFVMRSSSVLPIVKIRPSACETPSAVDLPKVVRIAG
jgi:hypothetical protein